MTCRIRTIYNRRSVFLLRSSEDVRSARADRHAPPTHCAVLETRQRRRPLACRPYGGWKAVLLRDPRRIVPPRSRRTRGDKAGGGGFRADPLGAPLRDVEPDTDE